MKPYDIKTRIIDNNLEITGLDVNQTASQAFMITLHKLLTHNPATRGVTVAHQGQEVTLTCPLLAPYRRAIVKVLSYFRDNIRLLGETTTTLGQHLQYGGVVTYHPGNKTFLVAPVFFEGFSPEASQVLANMGGYPKPDKNRSLSLSYLFDFMAANKNTTQPFVMDETLLNIVSKPITGYTGELHALQDHDISKLGFVHADTQTMRDKKKSLKTLADKLESFGFTSLYELLLNRPRTYIDKSQPQSIEELTFEEEATIIGDIAFADHMRNDAGTKFRINLEGGGTVTVTFFRQKWLKNKYPVGTQVLVTGVVKEFQGRPVITGKSIESLDVGRDIPVVPIYKQSPSKGITTKVISNATRELLCRLEFPGNTKIETPHYLRTPKVMPVQAALGCVHYPSSMSEVYAGLDALAWYEMVYTQILLRSAARTVTGAQGVTNPDQQNLVTRVVESLPYQLTGDQTKAVQQVLHMMGSDTPMSAMLSADVGAGKTIVQILGCLIAVSAGRQAALVAPTEILARQLHKSLQDVLECANLTDTVRAEFLYSGAKASEKKRITTGLKDGDINIVVGTHSILSDKISFQDLGFVCFDEQQKFGARQRTEILGRQEDGSIPDFMMATATPIPRSIAQAMFGDVTLLEIKEKPAGRKPIRTIWVPENPNDTTLTYSTPMWDDVRVELDLGHQAFVITPLVEDSDRVDAASVKSTHKALQSIALQGYKVACVWGKMKRAEQEQIMADFRDGKYDVLVASTVVEVGVDIPNATRMVILSAERLGASSLHQIRGRVGRNAYDCVCYLVSAGTTESAQRRLTSLVENQDGFAIAKEDLLTRAEGDVLSSNQSGGRAAKFATLRFHSHMLEAAAQKADNILDSQYVEEAIRDAKLMFSEAEILR